MAQFKVIPAIDLMDGKCVRLRQGDYAIKTDYAANPVETAQQFLDAGLTIVHVVDLDGARAGAPKNLKTVEKIAATGVTIEFGGGLRTASHLSQALDSGVHDLILGSSLLSKEAEISVWLNQYPGRFVAGIDAKDGQVAISGWEETTTIAATALAQKVTALGFSRIIYTDIAKDGMLQGSNVNQLKTIAKATTLPITASGGVGDIDHIHEVKALANRGITGIIVGKAFYEGKITLNEMAAC